MSNMPNTPNPSLSVLGKKIAFSALVQYAGKLVQIVLAAVTIKLITNFLSEGNYGVYAAITEYALFFSVVANLGLFANIIRKMADDPLNGKIFMNALFLRIFSALLFFLLAFVILIVNGDDQIFVVGTVLFLGALFFDFITSVCDGMLQANYMMGRATFALVLGRVVNFAAVFLIIRYFNATSNDINTWLILGAVLLGNLLTAALSIFFVRQKISFRFQIDRAFLWHTFLVSLPFGLINIVNNLYFRFLPDYFSHHILDDKQFGTFNISFRIAQVMSLFSTFLMFSALPGFKQYIDQKHWQKAHHLYQRLWQILAACGFLLVTLGSLLGPFMIETLTHKKYFLPEFWFVLPIMLLLAAISYGYDIILITLFAVEKDLWLLKRELIALSVGLTFFSLSLLPFGNIQLKLFLILLGAVVAEGTIVVLGSLKVRQIFREKLQHHEESAPQLEPAKL
jgi:O-antigen/teichoic acid export membrane protein